MMQQVHFILPLLALVGATVQADIVKDVQMFGIATCMFISMAKCKWYIQIPE